jgi:alpha-amylase
MFTAGGGPGEVHSYFSPYESPMDAFAVAQTLLNDFEARLRLFISAANEPFLFYTGIGKECYTSKIAWSLKGFIKAVSDVNPKAIEFHTENGDFESWIENSLKDQKLATQLRQLKDSKEKGEKLRETILDFTKKRYATLNKQTQEATKLF